MGDKEKDKSTNEVEISLEKYMALIDKLDEQEDNINEQEDNIELIETPDKQGYKRQKQKLFNARKFRCWCI